MSLVPTASGWVARGHNALAMPPTRQMPVQGDTVAAMPGGKAFVALHAACRGTGGMLRGGEVVRLLQAHQCGDFTSLARLILSDDIFSFAWFDAFWVPMFHFDRGDLSVKQGVRQVLAELSGDFDGWRLAVWFVRPSQRLAGGATTGRFAGGGSAVCPERCARRSIRRG